MEQDLSQQSLMDAGGEGQVHVTCLLLGGDGQHRRRPFGAQAWEHWCKHSGSIGGGGEHWRA